MRSCPKCGATWTEGEAFCPFDGTTLVHAPTLEDGSPDPWVGKVIDDRYRIDARLGSGGMGLVYRARHITLRTDVAIKMLRDSEAANPEVVERFRREAESATRIGHPGIVRVTDFGRIPNGPYFMVMELLEGSDLAQRLSRLGRLAPDYAVRLLLEACEALEAAHRAGIVHRDLKPENLFITRLPDGRERLKVVDFGLAKMNELPTTRGGQQLTRPGTIFGTPKYMSPEQGTGQASDSRSDVYALGCIAYEMLTGKAPFDGENYMGVITQHLVDPPPAFRTVFPEYAGPPGLEAVVLRALAKNPGDRHPSMEAFAIATSQASGLALPPPASQNPTPRPYVLPSQPELQSAPSLRPPPGASSGTAKRPVLPSRGGAARPVASAGRPNELRIDDADATPHGGAGRSALWSVLLVLAAAFCGGAAVWAFTR